MLYMLNSLCHGFLCYIQFITRTLPDALKYKRFSILPGSLLWVLPQIKGVGVCAKCLIPALSLATWGVLLMPAAYGLAMTEGVSACFGCGLKFSVCWKSFKGLEIP